MPPRRVVRPREKPVRIITLTVKAQKSAVSKSLQTLRTGLANGGIEEETLGRVEIALAEVLNNITEHGHAEAGIDTVSLSARISDQDIRVDIRDSGAVVPEACLNSAHLPDSSGPLHSLPEGGFGWFLIHSMVDDLRYSEKDGENQLELVFHRP
ncbi:ATP-binding protein [Roseovarius phycicola]|uniref:ATP-binding protein n=1 Tax=Roseovarius phycicola TaxID=3080976 RepID=A0ABZ2HHQ0_9RHOB